MNDDVPPLITVSGPPGSGTTTLVKALEVDGYEVLSGGDIFRQMAADRGMTLAEFSELAENDDSIDRELDARLEAEIDDHLAGERVTDGDGLVVESRLAGWHASNRAKLAVWLDAPVEVRASRIDDRTETAAQLRERERSEARRYEEYYGIDINDLSVYDVVANTETLSEVGVKRIVRAALADVTDE